MKALKVKIRKTTNIRKFSSLPEEEKTAQRFKKLKKMECPCCGGTMYLANDVWRCYNCAYCITQKDMLDNAAFWFCDDCKRFMNIQPGFTNKTGAWKCISCGWVNDVSEDNIID